MSRDWAPPILAVFVGTLTGVPHLRWLSFKFLHSVIDALNIHEPYCKIHPIYHLVKTGIALLNGKLYVIEAGTTYNVAKDRQ